MTSRRRIALIGYTFYESDARLRMYVDYLKSGGYEIDVYVLKQQNAQLPPEKEGVRIFRLGKRSYNHQSTVQYLARYAWFTLAVCRLLIKHCMKGPCYAIIHVNNMPNFLILSALPLRIIGMPLLLDVHDTMPEIYKVRSGAKESAWITRALFIEERFCTKLASYVITSEHTKQDRLLENGLARSKSSVILNLANPDLFPEVPLSESRFDPGECFRIVYHGMLTWRLGVDTVIRAIGIARDALPNIRYEIIGDGEQRHSLIELTRELNLECYVTFSNGFVPVEALAERLRGADLAVIASRLNSATDLMLPVKLLEYVRLGIPCVVAPTKTIRRYFSNSSVRYLEHNDDPRELAETIVALARNPKRRRKMAQAARTFYESYNYETQRKAYLYIIHELVAKRRPVVAEH